MVARDDAVSAVSLPAKKADSRMQIRMTASDSQSCRIIGQARFNAIDIAFPLVPAKAGTQNDTLKTRSA
jgi:hypothetical protein